MALIALLVGAVGIITTLYTSVTERVREIGTMKAIGAQGRFILFIFMIFMTEAIIIGILGACAGIFTGVVGGYLLTSGFGPRQGVFGGPGGGAQFSPVFLASDLGYVWALSVGISIVAGIYPAWKASRLSLLN